MPHSMFVGFFVVAVVKYDLLSVLFRILLAIQQYENETEWKAWWPAKRALEIFALKFLTRCLFPQLVLHEPDKTTQGKWGHGNAWHSSLGATCNFGTYSGRQFL